MSPPAAPSIGRRPSRAQLEEPNWGVEYLGQRLFSGTGELLGIVVGIEPDRWGRPKHLRFVEPGALESRRAPLRVVRRVDDDGIHLAGPRDGYHITRLGE